ncbi:MAG: hypothetical protein AAF378_05130 [Cyanobacteria bacterium P01_A01_bin.84]
MTNITVSTNGHNKKANMETITEVTPIESTTTATTEEQTQPKKKAKSGRHNKVANFYLDIDAGAKRVKCRLNGVYKAFPSTAKKIKGDVPLRTDGAFNYGSTSYVVGQAIDRVNGDVINASSGNKLTNLDLWIVGAMTHYRKQLKQAIKDKKRNAESIKINLYVRILTLSTMKRKELDKAVKKIEAFTWEDNLFEVDVKSLEFIEEGQGAADYICQENPDIETFHLLDLGGGTFSATTYDWDGDDAAIIARTPISGAGMVTVINRIFKALTRVDRGAIQAENEDIQQALELSKVTEDGYTVPLRSNGKTHDIAEEVEGALSEWVSNNYALQRQFDLISQSLAKGEPVYCSGGGFAVPIVSNWIVKYLSQDIDNPQIEILPEPQNINLIGMAQIEAK